MPSQIDKTESASTPKIHNNAKHLLYQTSEEGQHPALQKDGNEFNHLPSPSRTDTYPASLDETISNNNDKNLTSNGKKKFLIHTKIK